MTADKDHLLLRQRGAGNCRTPLQGQGKPTSRGKGAIDGVEGQGIDRIDAFLAALCPPVALVGVPLCLHGQPGCQLGMAMMPCSQATA